MEKTKKVLCIFIALIMIFGSMATCVTNVVYAIEAVGKDENLGANPINERENLVEIGLDRAISISIENNTASIMYDNGTVNVSGDNLQYYRDDNWNYGEAGFGTKYFLYTTSTSLTFNTIPCENYSVSCWVDGNNTNMVNNAYTCEELSIGNNYNIEFIFENQNNNNPGGEEYSSFNTTANISVSAGAGTYTKKIYNPATESEEEIQQPYDNDVIISINNGERWDCERNSTTISYDSTTEENTVNLTFETLWINRIYGNIVINDVPYTVSDYLNFDNRDEWLIANHGSQTLSFTITGVAKSDSYNIVIKNGENTGKKYFATFLWTADPEQADSHDYIGHSKLEFVKAEYEVAGTKYIVTENDIEGNLVREGEFDNFHSADGFLQYGTTHDVDYDDGSLTLPGNAKVTMRVVPEYGYQVTSVNGRKEFATTDDGVSEFTVMVAEGEAGYFQATVEEVGNTVRTTSENVKTGEIELGEHAAEDIKNGTVRLSVEDIELSSDKIADFQDEANKAGNYTISNYLDINLDKVLYRGTDTSVWKEQIHHLTDKALITLQLEEGIKANDIVIVHNIDNGDQFEIIQIESYDPETNTITFYTDSFSNYAIAQCNNEIGEPVFTVTYDFNGGNRHGESKYITTSVGFVPIISVENFIDWMEVTAPSGKELDAIEINGVRYELGSYYELNKDTTYKYLWKDTTESHIHNYTTTITKATLNKNGSIVAKCVCGDEKNTTTIFHPETYTLSKTIFTYNSKKVQKPTITIKNCAGEIINAKNYTVSYSNKNSKKIGEYSITVTFKGDYYEGQKTLTYQIAPKGTSMSKVKAGKKSFTASWKKQTSETTGYEIQYSTSKYFTSGNKNIDIKKNKVTSTTKKKLKAKKTYYVRIRTYKKVNGKKIYSNWSSYKSVKTKK